MGIDSYRATDLVLMKKTCTQKGSQELVTIGLMVYNNKDTLVRSLDCLVHQDYPVKELVICDDASSDGSYEICEDYARRFPFIRLYRHEKNVGCFANLDFLLKQIRGTYFLWACPDDVYDTTFVRKCVGCFKENNALAAVNSRMRLAFLGDCAPNARCLIEDRIERFHPIHLASLTSFAARFQKAVDIVKYKDAIYCLYIHGLIRTDFLSFLQQGPRFHGVEEFVPIVLIYLGGLGVVPEVLHTKYQSRVPLAIRNPRAAKIYNSLWSCFLSVLLMLRFSARDAHLRPYMWELWSIALRTLGIRTFIKLCALTPDFPKRIVKKLLLSTHDKNEEEYNDEKKM